MGNAVRERVGTKRQTRIDRRAYGTIWPNGEFSLCWPKERRDCVEESSERADGVFSGKRLVSSRALASLCTEIQTQAEAESAEASSASAEGGGSSRAGCKYGLKGITQYGKRFVRSGAAMLQREYGRQRLSFLTLTLPELEQPQIEAIAEQWGVVVNHLLKWLTRHLTKSGLPRLVVSVTELQPKRLRAGSLSVLHLHLLFVGRRRVRGPWALSPSEVRSAWLKILSNFAGVELHSNSCENLKQVEKSAEGYLGKYMSKGVEDVRQFIEMGSETLVPGQWWNCTKALREWVKAAIVRGPNTGSLLECVVESALEEGCKAMGVYMRPVILDLDGGPWLAAWVGRLSRSLAEDLTGMLKSRLIEI